MTLFAGYEWMDSVDPLPVLVEKALDESMVFSTFEKDALPLDVWQEETGMNVPERGDFHPFGGLWLSALIQRAGLGMTRDPVLASSFRRFGADIVAPDKPSLGDVILWKELAGNEQHDVVGLLIGEDRTCFHVLYLANTFNTVLQRIPNASVTAIRRPIYDARPWSAQHVDLKVDGGLSRDLIVPGEQEEVAEEG